jgi:hypothetical protein
MAAVCTVGVCSTPPPQALKRAAMDMARRGRIEVVFMMGPKGKALLYGSIVGSKFSVDQFF